MRRWGWIIGFVCSAVLATGCATVAPDQVRSSLAHQLDDLAACEAELLPLVPDDATVTFTTVSGTTATRPAKTVWKQLLRGMLFRGAGLKAWADGEPYDEAAAFAKLFPELVKEQP